VHTESHECSEGVELAKIVEIKVIIRHGIYTVQGRHSDPLLLLTDKGKTAKDVDIVLAECSWEKS
jgi:hypothetical protein